MENSTFSLFQAREVAENYVSNIYESTCTVSAVVHVAVDPSYRCLSVPETGNERKLAEQQSVCIFRVRYINGSAVVNQTEYVSDKLMSEK
jgi:hypothetical protein